LPNNLLKTAPLSQLSPLEQKACKLLLRSPRLTISQIMSLMDIGDRQFRELIKTDKEIRRLIKQRKDGKLKPYQVETSQCLICEDLFRPYGSTDFCSDECAKTASIDRRKSRVEQLRAKHLTSLSIDVPSRKKRR